MIETSLYDALQEHFGFDKFKGDQEAIIQSVLDNKDTFVIMPTGGGKSLCYQLPALLLEGTALVISPLIALMKNQVDSIRAHSQKEEIAHFLNSSLTKVQSRKVKEDIKGGQTKLLFVAPETLTKSENIEFFKEIPLSFVAVDEAHCISEWGHDFRPEYRKIRQMIEAINNEIPIIALTATATPKVRMDIVKNLAMREPNIFLSSFNREKLFYEVRPKGTEEQVMKNILQIVKSLEGESGIVYVQSRKAAEEIAEKLRINDIKAAGYHAGMEPKLRSKTQDDFLMEEIDVICATIAFGMGIDKPNIRFVIHYNIPKSIENYYQETGRAGRDGLGGKCVAFYAYKDIQKLEKFLRDKPVAERELTAQLMNEIVAYSETSSCRRRFLLHYFGEEYICPMDGLCDNCKTPPEMFDGKEYLNIALQTLLVLNENFKIRENVEFVIGKETKTMLDFKFDKLDLFGKGKGKDEHFWNSIFRQAMLNNLIRKDIEQYGVLKITDTGREFITNPKTFEIPLNRNLKNAVVEADPSEARIAVLDTQLLKMLRAQRKTVAKQKGIPPFVVFQDISLNEMATQYPTSVEDMAKIAGVSKGKAIKFGASFIALISTYVEENNIDRPSEFIVKSIVDKSRTKVEIIKGVDKKVPLYDIASSNNLSMEELLEEIEMIVSSGTKLDIRYHIEEVVDEYAEEDIMDHFKESESDSIDEAFNELKDDDISLEEIQLIRIKMISELGN